MKPFNDDSRYNSSETNREGRTSSPRKTYTSTPEGGVKKKACPHWRNTLVGYTHLRKSATTKQKLQHPKQRLLGGIRFERKGRTLVQHIGTLGWQTS